ncbi:putative malate transporter YflS [Posidoniimonas polymericola]|uniref:Putative malate transporter YflS n=1 Tax=Posidoniimonas polymericola TaxID=2528002 RepID=A0A5C5YME7_9BACT|nr:DASS family sodium-coupled anion symporter [Posidoniimonas polymericola]TWT76025.1 putative malate transporter YflS [Posidoniimonas polymericola]
MQTHASEPRSLVGLAVCVAVGAALWSLPTPVGLTTPAWHIFAVFAATIFSFLIRPLPMGPCVLLGLLALTTSGDLRLATDDYAVVLAGQADGATADEVAAAREWLAEHKTLDSAGMKQALGRALAGFADTTTWLVVSAFMISGAMIRSGLGQRVALSMVTLFGRTTLGLGYAIGAAELILAPFVPSNTARGGGVMAPIVNSLSQVLGSRPEDSPKKAGEYLVLVGAHANLITAAMFLTGMAANPLVNKAAEDVFGPEAKLSWGQWLLGSSAPGLLSLALLPLVIYWLARPEATASGEACKKAQADLQEMGPWTPKQLTMGAILVSMLTLWMTAPLQQMWIGFSLHTTLVALLGVAAIVVLGVDSWREVTSTSGAWDALIWLGGLVSMANALRETGFTGWFADSVGGHVTGLSPLVLAVTLTLVYFFSMYAFSMLTGHIMAFAGVFFATALAAGAPPLLMVALIAYFSNLCGCTTNYSTGPVVIYYGLGYVTAPKWFYVGFVVGLVHLAVWLGVGLPYWKLLGWW